MVVTMIENELTFLSTATSGGQEKELDNQYQGACYTHKMRMILRITPPDNSRPGTSPPPLSLSLSLSLSLCISCTMHASVIQ